MKYQICFTGLTTKIIYYIVTSVTYAYTFMNSIHEKFSCARKNNLAGAAALK